MTASLRRLAFAMILAPALWVSFSEPARAQGKDRIPIVPDEIPEVAPWIEGPVLGDRDQVNVIVSTGQRAPARAAPRSYFAPPEGPPIPSPLYKASQAAGAPEPGEPPEGTGESLRHLRALHQSARGETRRRLSRAIETLERNPDRDHREVVREALWSRSAE